MKTIRAKLMLIMLASTFVITIVLSIVAIRSINRSTEGTLRSSVEPLTVQASRSFDTTMRQYTTNFSTSAKSALFAEKENVNDMLNILKSGFSSGINEYCSFTVFAEDGSILVTDSKELAELTPQEEVEDAASKSSVVITDLMPLNNKIYFTIFQSATANGRKVVAAVTINAEVLNNLILDNSFGENGYGYLVDDEGSVLIHKDSSKALTHFNPINEAKNNEDYKELSNAMKTILSTEDGSCSYSIDDKKCIAGFSSTDYFGSTLILVLVVKDFNSTTTVAMTNILIIGISILIITIGISLFYASRISKPIISATKRIRLLAQGNLSDPVDVWYSKDELGILTNSLEETIVCLRQYINLITVSLEQISEGNLCHRMEGTFKGDFQQIKTTFNDILDSLSDTFASINTAAEQVTSGAIQVSNSAQEVSQGSTQQASAIEELSVTLNDVAKQVSQNSDDARNAYNIVSENTSAIGSCNDDMDNMLKAINAIYTSSSEISKIIKVIDEIAFQTNILALNAAVEAAREGSKGFGVVADEVRRLASRSAEAAKQTAALIENSVAAVSKGNEIAQKTAASLRVIVDSSNEIQGLVKNISEASEDQTESIVQINTGLDQISAVVSANTSSSVGTASASEELSSQSLILKNMIARFKLSNGDETRKKGRFKYDYDSLPDPEDSPDNFEDYNSDDVSEFIEDNDNDKY
ncbi:MAG: methyl-accepting chemotaxis protein [Ruminococcus sp.]|nr:methyl-accepting chemotaxis protein [Ruminococcus sp.]